MKKLYLLAVLAAVLCYSFHSNDHKPYTTAVTSWSADTTDLPDAYKNRKFISSAAGIEDAASIPGNIAQYDSSSSAYEITTLRALIKGNKPAVMQKPANGVIFSGKVTSDTKFNGSYLISGLKIEKNQEMDLNIRDDAMYSVPDGQADTASIKAATKSLSPNERKKLFYITSATVSIITYNIHDKANATMDKLDKLSKGKPDTAKKGAYYKIKESKTPAPYSSSGANTKMLTDKTISIVAVPVDDMTRVTPVKK
jgi:hypothetical protein